MRLNPLHVAEGCQPLLPKPLCQQGLPARFSSKANVLRVDNWNIPRTSRSPMRVFVIISYCWVKSSMAWISSLGRIGLIPIAFLPASAASGVRDPARRCFGVCETLFEPARVAFMLRPRLNPTMDICVASASAHLPQREPNATPKCNAWIASRERIPTRADGFLFFGNPRYRRVSSGCVRLTARNFASIASNAASSRVSISGRRSRRASRRPAASMVASASRRGSLRKPA